MYRLAFAVLSLLLPLSLMGKVIEVRGIVRDQAQGPIPGVTVLIKGTQEGTSTDLDGKFKLRAKEGAQLVFSAVGYKTKELRAKSRFMTVVLVEADVALQEVVVAVGDYHSDAKLSRVHVRALASQVYGYGLNTHDAEDPSSAREGYENRKRNSFELVQANPLSTLSVDVDVASYGDMRRSISSGRLPFPEAVRVEEFINYFDYAYPKPQGGAPVSLSATVSTCPWNTQHQLLRVGLKAQEIPSESLPASNFVYLIDVSGSMAGPERLGLVKTSLKLLTNNLRPQDRVAIVTYASGTQVALPSTSGANRSKIREVIEGLRAGGSTAGASGIKLAYEEARKHFVKQGNNRVILCTDGDFNVGVSSSAELEELITKERQSGIFLTVLGYGMGNYKDKKLQTLAEKGNGNHAYIDGAEEANKVLVSEFGSTMYAVAKDVKLQLEFNPQHYTAYRLIGYESRLLADQDFNDDTKDAAELGAGHTVTALYELIPTGVNSPFIPEVDSLRYQTPAASPHADELLTVKLRYKPLNSDESRLLTLPVKHVERLSAVDKGYHLASAVALFAELLCKSEYVREASYADVLRLVQPALSEDPFGEKHEFVRLVQTAESLSRLEDQPDKSSEED